MLREGLQSLVSRRLLPGSFFSLALLFWFGLSVGWRFSAGASSSLRYSCPVHHDTHASGFVQPCAAASPAIALGLQSTPPAGRGAVLGSFGDGPMNPPKLLDSIIRSGPADFLMERTFRKKARVFFREVGGVFQYVHFFTSRWTTAEVASFTLQIGVTFRHCHPKRPENMLTDLIPVVGRRFGPDVDHPTGQFWVSDSVEPTASEVLDRLKNHVIPFFEIHSAEELYRIWEAGGRIVQLPTLRISMQNRLNS